MEALCAIFQHNIIAYCYRVFNMETLATYTYNLNNDHIAHVKNS